MLTNNKKTDKNLIIGWLKVLDPELLKNNLLNVALFILTYEMFKDSVIGKPESFFTIGFTKGKDIIDEDYKKEVIELCPKNLFHASCLWFKSRGAICQNDIDLIEEIRKYRNDIVHELPKYIGTAENNINKELYHKLYELMNKIDKWWILNVEVATDPDFDDKEIKEDDVQSGNMLMLSLISYVLEGKDDFIKDFRDQLKDILKESETVHNRKI